MAKLPLESLEIRGYRLFRELTIPRLARLNLITGRNNVGKTALLEAIRLWADRGAPKTLLRIALARQETPDASDQGVPGRPSRMLRALFLRSADEAPPHPIRIGPVEQLSDLLHLFLGETAGSPKYVAGGGPDVPGSVVFPLGGQGWSEHWLVVQYGDVFRCYPVSVLSRFGPTIHVPDVPQYNQAPQEIACRLVPPGGADLAEGVRIWSQLVLTPLEDRAVAALQVVAPEIERVAVQGMHDIERELPEPIQSLVREAPVPAGSFRVRLAGHPRPVPLRSLGEGVSRLLGISLEMTQVQGGLLLIDEFENGLHHTIQAEVWSHLLAIARELDVQVVATTHSYDAVVAFQETIRKHPDEGLLIRLQRAGDVCRATTFTGEELQIVAREQIEVR